MVKDRDGNIISNKREILNRWRQYFEELLNERNEKNDNKQNRPNEPNEQQNAIMEEENPPSLNEVREAIKKLKNNKSPEEDTIPAELLKATGGKLMTRILEITDIWDKEELL